MLKIGLIVEGHGDRLALPGLVTRVSQEIHNRFDIIPSTPVRINRGKFSNRFDDYERALQLLAKRNDGILVVLDSDDDDPEELASGLESRAQAVVGFRKTRVAPAVREFESWFLASLAQMRGEGGVRPDADCEGAPDQYAGAKSAFARNLLSGVYSETVDQKRYCALIDLGAAKENSPSFLQFTKCVDDLISSSGQS